MNNCHSSTQIFVDPYWTPDIHLLRHLWMVTKHPTFIYPDIYGWLLSIWQSSNQTFVDVWWTTVIHLLRHLWMVTKHLTFIYPDICRCLLNNWLSPIQTSVEFYFKPKIDCHLQLWDNQFTEKPENHPPRNVWLCTEHWTRIVQTFVALYWRLNIHRLEIYGFVLNT